MPVQKCEQVLQVPPGELNINLVALAVVAPAVPQPPPVRPAVERVVQVIAQQPRASRRPLDSALADGELQLEVVQKELCWPRVPLGLEMDDETAAEQCDIPETVEGVRCSLEGHRGRGTRCLTMPRAVTLAKRIGVSHL